MRAAVDALSRLITPTNDSIRLRTAKIAAFTSTRATITLAGSNVPNVPYLANYAPAIGHTVLVLQTNAGLLIVLGRAT